jgi:hypothetical protein
VSGHALLLPSTNVPGSSNRTQQQLDADPTKNFGSFQALAASGEVQHDLEVVDYSSVKGHLGQALGLGVRTTVSVQNEV